MRPFLLISLVLIGSLGLGACQGQQAGVDVVDEAATETRLSLAELRQMLEDADDERVMVVAHRACWRLAPENSLHAIDECVRLGVDMIEIDVRRSKDGHLMLMHDGTVDRMTDGSGPIEEMTLDGIQELRLKEGAGGEDAALTEKRVPTLEQALLAAEHAAGHVDDQNLADPDAHWGHLIDMKVDMIQTDRPELLMEYLTSRGYRDRGARSPR